MIEKFITLFFLCCISAVLDSQQPAFPGAEGYGRYSSGGRGGRVIYVENLNDDGHGSLRMAVNEQGPRTVIFTVSGTIELQSDLIIAFPFITIAGQTAPGDGICLKNFPLRIRNCHDVIIRFIRIRPGTEKLKNEETNDAIEIRESKNIIIDHCTAGWSTDEIVNCWHGSSDITVQWCILAEPLNHSVHPKGDHGYAASIGGKRVTFHHNLIANSPGRNPSIAGDDKNPTDNFEFINNVVFNYGHRACDGKPMTITFLANYYKPGPSTLEDIKRQIVRIDNSLRYGYQSLWYIERNAVEGYRRYNTDDWKELVSFEEGTSEKINRLSVPSGKSGLVADDAVKAYEDVIRFAGVISPGRDSNEKRIISEAESRSTLIGNGIIDNVEQAGGWPILKTKPPFSDSDNDGMPDEWENRVKLNSADPADGSLDRNRDGFTNLEIYLNSIVEKSKLRFK